MKNEQQIYFKEDSCVEINPNTKKVINNEEDLDSESNPISEIFY